MVGLLFFALVYLAFGQADVRRNGTQTAADAAALAAAQESRDQVDLADFLDDLGDLLDGEITVPLGGCEDAVRFAVKNEAKAEVGCAPLQDGRWGFTVQVESAQPMGDSIIDGTEGERAVASATALVEPRDCTFESDEPESPPANETPDPGEDEGEKPTPGTLECDTEDWVIDPENLEALPEMADLFTVRLAED